MDIREFPSSSSDTLRHGCFPVNLRHISGTAFCKTTSEVLLLYNQHFHVFLRRKHFSIITLQHMIHNFLPLLSWIVKFQCPLHSWLINNIYPLVYISLYEIISFIFIQMIYVFQYLSLGIRYNVDIYASCIGNNFIFFADLFLQ